MIKLLRAPHNCALTSQIENNKFSPKTHPFVMVDKMNLYVVLWRNKPNHTFFRHHKLGRCAASRPTTYWSTTIATITCFSTLYHSPPNRQSTTHLWQTHSLPLPFVTPLLLQALAYLQTHTYKNI